MRQKIIFSLIFLLVITFSSFAQNITITGVVIDTQQHVPIANATVSAIRAADSVLIKFVRTKTDGSFSMQVPDSVLYNLLVAHPLYASLQDDADAKGQTINKGNIGLTNRSKVLQGIVVRQRGSIRIKGDTTIYLADSFKVNDNASVEDLLKVLPGMQVDKNGNIITQGEQVQKVLVDGEEFFGDDPTVATKNLQAKTIDKVEVFDNKSEQTKFTGFDDGQREKTINLKMKANMNKGVFGKVQAASNLDQIWDNSAMISSFKNKRKLSVYGINSSRGSTGLNWSDRSRFGGGAGDNMVEEDGMMYMYSTNDQGDMGYDGDGLPKANNIGLHYSNKWNEGKQSLNTNANVRENFITKNESNNTINYLGANTIGTISTDASYANRQNAKLSTKFEVTIDTTSSVTIYVDGAQTNGLGKSTSSTQNLKNKIPVSSSQRSYDNSSTNQNASTDISYKKHMKKLGRTFSINTNWAWKNNKVDNKVIGNNEFNTTSEILNQQKRNKANAITGSIRTVFTEPLVGEKLFSEMSYALNVSNNLQNNITSIQPTTSNEYTEQVDSLSNTFSSNVVSNTIGYKLMYKIKKFSINGGTNVRYSIFKQLDAIRQKPYNYNRWNVLPTMNMSYKISSQQSVRLSYNGSTSQPTVFQLQDVLDISDPLNISRGNPNLKLAYQQSMNLNYWNYQTLSDRSFNASIWFNNTFNSISRYQQFESATGRTINSYTNVNGRFSIGSWASFNAKLKNNNYSVSCQLNPSYTRQPIIANGVVTYGNTISTSVRTGLSYSKKKKFDASIDMEFGKNYYSNTILGQKNNYYTWEPNLDVDVYVTKRFTVSTDAVYIWQQKNSVFGTDFTRTLWNASVNYKFLKQKNLEFGIVAKDMLNQNNGYTRNNYGNTVSENSTNTIRRYVLLQLIYNFSHGPINKLPTDDDED